MKLGLHVTSACVFDVHYCTSTCMLVKQLHHVSHAIMYRHYRSELEVNLICITWVAVYIYTAFSAPVLKSCCSVVRAFSLVVKHQVTRCQVFIFHWKIGKTWSNMMMTRGHYFRCHYKPPPSHPHNYLYNTVSSHVRLNWQGSPTLMLWIYNCQLDKKNKAWSLCT